MRAYLLMRLLDLACRGPDEQPEEYATSADLAELSEAGLFTGTVVTERGEAYIAALETVPLPVQRWVIPEIDHATAKRIEPQSDLGQHQDGDGARQASKTGRRNRHARGREK